MSSDRSSRTAAADLMSINELASELGVSVGRVRQWLHVAEDESRNPDPSSLAGMLPKPTSRGITFRRSEIEAVLPAMRDRLGHTGPVPEGN